MGAVWSWAVCLTSRLGLHLLKKKFLPLPGIEPSIHTRPARSVHPPVRELSGLQGKQSINLWFACLPHLRTNIISPYTKTVLQIFWYRRSCSASLLLAMIRSSSSKRNVWGSEQLELCYASLLAFRVTFAHTRSTQAEVHMCPTFCSRAQHVSTTPQHFIFLIALYAYGRKIMSFFVCLYCVAWYPSTDCNLNTSWVTSKVIIVRVLTACFLIHRFER
jgi:hypothetical protein